METILWMTHRSVGGANPRSLDLGQHRGLLGGGFSRSRSREALSADDASGRA